jgi:hypothetical protein
MLSTIHISTALCLVGILVAGPSLAENVRIPLGQQGGSWQASLPRTGETQARVRQVYGDPLETKAPVGNPPISSWHYANFTVYFEYDHVIHTVASSSGYGAESPYPARQEPAHESLDTRAPAPAAPVMAAPSDNDKAPLPADEAPEAVPEPRGPSDNLAEEQAKPASETAPPAVDDTEPRKRRFPSDDN